MPERKRVKFEVEVDLDPVLGEFFTKENALGVVEYILLQRLPHYSPTVKLIEED